MKKINHIMQFIIVRILFFLFEIIGYEGSSNLGYFIGKYLGPFFRSKLSIKKNLQKAKIGESYNYKKISTNILEIMVVYLQNIYI